MQYKNCLNKQWKYSQAKNCLLVFDAKPNSNDLNGKNSFAKSVSTEYKVEANPEFITEKQLILFDVGNNHTIIVDSSCEIKGTVRVMEEKSGMFEVIK